MRHIISEIRSWYPALGLLFLIGCTSPGPVTTQINTKKNPVVSAPSQFQSPMTAIQNFAEARRGVSKETDSFSNGALRTLLTQQEKIKNELSESGKLRLEPGHSYEFTLESFCVNAGIERPVVGDGLYIGDITGSPKNWLPQIATQYKISGLSQNEAQVLIWSLLSGTRFDELNFQNQQNLLKIFPDAPTKFGNSFLESKAKDFVWNQLPTELVEAQDKWSQFQNLLQNAQSSFQQIENVLSPQSHRKSPLPVGWLKTQEGYLINLMSQGYRKVHVKIYVPEDLKKSTYFDPTQKIALPGEGQRLSLSNQVVNEVSHFGKQFFKDLTAITPAEARFIVQYPEDSFKIYQAAVRAKELTYKHFPESKTFSQDRSDAFRHFFWSSRISHEVGPAKAQKYLDAHEDFPNNPVADKKMDLHNNSKGIQFGSSYTGSSFESDCIENGFKKIKDRELVWLK